MERIKEIQQTILSRWQGYPENRSVGQAARVQKDKYLDVRCPYRDSTGWLLYAAMDKSQMSSSLEMKRVKDEKMVKEECEAMKEKWEKNGKASGGN